MQSSPSASEDTPSTKAALDHLQVLIEQLLRENHHLKLSLQQARSQLDEVRAHLNRFKLRVAENERNDHVMRKQIRSMTALIQRHRDGISPPSSPEVRPTPPPSPVSKSSPSPNSPSHKVLPTDVANISDLASISPTPAIHNSPPMPEVNGNCFETAAAENSDTVSHTDSPGVCVKKEREPEPARSLNTEDVITSSPSSPKQSQAEKVSSPSTSVSDALQKAFVAMEKDTTNTVQVLHDTKSTVSLQTASSDKGHTEKVPHLSLVKDTTLDTRVHDTNGMQGDHPQQNLKKQPGSSRKRSLKRLKRKVTGTSPASDTDVTASAKRSAKKSVNGRLTRSLTQVQSARSPPQSANHLAKSVSLKKTKKGYKVSLALSRKSSKSGDSSSGSSDSDSDSSGPGCTASASGLLSRPGKAQVSLKGGIPEFMSGARKLKDRFKHHKEDDGKQDGDDQNIPALGGKESEVNSSHPNLSKDGENGIGNGSFVPSAAATSNDAALRMSRLSEVGHESFPYARGSPKLRSSIREEKPHLHGAVMMNEKLTNDRGMLQHHEQSVPFTSGNTNRLENIQLTSDVPHNPVPVSAGLVSLGSDRFSVQRTNGRHPNALENHAEVTVSANEASRQDVDDQSLAAGKATNNDLGETSADAEIATIHEITHVPVRPRSFSYSDKRDAISSSNLKSSPGGTTEFLTVRSGSSEMLLWKARPGSKYVDASSGALAVKHSAAVSCEDGKVVMNGKMRVLRPVGVTPINPNDCYVSSTYPDGTLLPYVPVSGVVLHGKPVLWDSSQYADQSVQLSFSKEVFDNLVLHVRRAYRRRHPGAQVNFPGALVAAHRVRKVVRIEPECSVNMTRIHRAPAKCSVAETLATVKKDVVGLVLLYLSIEGRSEDCLSVEVIFGLHSMVAHHLSTDRRR